MGTIERLITEYRRRRANRILQRADSARYDYERPTDDYDWITIKGQHTPIDDGHIVGGVGGKFKGKAYTGSKMQQSKKRIARLAEKAKSAANGVRRVALRMTNAAKRIAEAKSIPDIKKIFEEEFGTKTQRIEGDWLGYSSDIDDSFNSDAIKGSYVGLADSFTEFPELKRFVPHITSYRSGVACFANNEHWIAVNPAYYKSDKIYKTCKETSESGWWPKNSSPASVMAHEAAHALQYLIAGKMGKTAPTYCSAIVRKAIANVQRNGYGKGKSSQEMRSGVSKQAAERNTKETVSESFADCFANGENANPLSIEIRRLVVEDYKKYFSGERKEDVGDPSTWAQIRM